MLRPVSGRKESKVMLTEATSEGARGDIPSPYCSIDRLTRRCCTAACDCRHHLYDVCQMCLMVRLVRAKEARACGQAERERRKDDLLRDRCNSELAGGQNDEDEDERRIANGGSVLLQFAACPLPRIRRASFIVT